MKHKYRIGFSALLVLFVVLISAGYHWSYKAAEKEYLEKYQSAESSMTEGEIKKNTGYYLDELHGFVVVYMSDRKTIFETTAIRLDSLPEELQGNIRKGMYIQTAEELYQFLENYSS